MTNDQIIERLKAAGMKWAYRGALIFRNGMPDTSELVAEGTPEEWTALLVPADTVTISREIAAKALHYTEKFATNASTSLAKTMAASYVANELRMALNPPTYIGTDSAGNARVARTDGGTAAETSPCQYICPMCGSPDLHHSIKTCVGECDGE